MSKDASGASGGSQGAAEAEWRDPGLPCISQSSAFISSGPATPRPKTSSEEGFIGGKGLKVQHYPNSVNAKVNLQCIPLSPLKTAKLRVKKLATQHSPSCLDSAIPRCSPGAGSWVPLTYPPTSHHQTAQVQGRRAPSLTRPLLQENVAVFSPAEALPGTFTLSPIGRTLVREESNWSPSRTLRTCMWDDGLRRGYG